MGSRWDHASMAEVGSWWALVSGWELCRSGNPRCPPHGPGTGPFPVRPDHTLLLRELSVRSTGHADCHTECAVLLFCKRKAPHWDSAVSWWGWSLPVVVGSGHLVEGSHAGLA